MTRTRPSLKIADENRAASFPAAEVNIEEAYRDALDSPKYYQRMGEPCEVEKAAIAYAADCMQTAIVRLGLLAGGPEGVKGGSGWKARVAQQNHKELALVLTHASKPGAYCLSINVKPELTEQARTEIAALKQSLTAQLEAEGLSAMDIMMREILKKAPKNELETRIAEMKADGANFLPIGPDHTLLCARAYAMKLPLAGWNGQGLGGNPVGVEDTCSLEVLSAPANREGWNRGLCLEMSPVSKYQIEEGYLWPSTRGTQVMPHMVLEVLSDLIRSNGLADLVEQRDREICTMPWAFFGSGNALALQELGHGLVHRAKGFYDASVNEVIRDFSNAIAAADVANHLDEFVELVPRMIEQHHIDEAGSFDANDLRDQAHAAIDGNTLTLFTRTQNGQYRLDMVMDGEAVSEVHAWRTAGPQILKPVGRFLMEEVLVADYAGAKMGGPPIDYTIRNIRDLNGLVSSLSSVACVFNEEHPKRPSDDPGGPDPM